MNLVENELYYFDAVAAERPIKFIEQNLCLYEDKWAGQPVSVLPYHRDFITKLYGWKRRDNDLRRFRELFLETPKGNAKSEALTFCGLYELLASGERGALIISAATDFKQANITFDSAKNIIRNSPRLAKMEQDGKIIVKQYSIEYPATNSKWVVMSGDFAGKAGFRPTVILLDEAWEFPNRKMYDSLTRNAKKRSQPLVLVATNSGNRKDTICHELHERAQRVLDGTSKDDTLLPVIYCTDQTKDDPSKRETWAKANPALDIIITTETLRDEWVKAKENPALEAEFRRLHCGQWVEGGSEKWIDMVAYDECVTAFGAATVKALPLVLGLDMSLNDDLTALVYVWIGEEKLYVKARFWLPRATAYRYEDKNPDIKYTEWAKLRKSKRGKELPGDITLIEAKTIDPATHRMLAKLIGKINKRYDLKALAYDTKNAPNVVALVSEMGIPVVPIMQGFHLSPALNELKRRLTDRTIAIAPNKVMRWCASNVETRTGDLGGIKLKKESASEGKYKGLSKLKIDGIQALATAIQHVRLLLMQPAAKPSVYEDRGVFVVDF